VSAKVIVWTDYVSPYAFVAKAGAYALEAAFQIELDWRPYTLDIAGFVGSVEARDAHRWRKVRYSYMDARRQAVRQGLILKGPRKVYRARAMNTGLLYARHHNVFRAYHDRAFELFWQREIDPEDPAAVATLLADVGAPSGFEAFLAGVGGAEHDRLRAEAEESGVFGVPTFVFEGELFWGGDRIDMLARCLEERGVPRRQSAPAA